MAKHAVRKAVRPDVTPLLTLQEACSHLGVSRGSFYRWLANPELKLKEIAAHLPGGRMRFPLDKLDAWLAQQS